MPRRARRSVTGVPAASRAFYRRYAQLVYSVCCQVLGHGELAAEATTRVFVEAWKSLPASSSAGGVDDWLAGLARRVAVELSERHRGPDQAQSNVAHPGRGESSASAGRIRRIWQVREALERLSPADRELIRLQHRREPAYSQVGDRQSDPRSVTADSLRAHRRLVELLAGS